MAQNQEIILYHYSFSPFAKRVVWYLNLRGIPYTECKQPPTMPRPDLAAIGTNYRRIPIVSIGADIYNDTRLILSKLEAFYPDSRTYPSISSSSQEGQILQKLLESWAIDSGVFNRAGQLIPSDTPLLKDEKFQRDREQYSGRPWSKNFVDKARPESLVEMRSYFDMVERNVLGDGRDWVLNGEGPCLADIEAIWVFHWMKTLKGALPSNYISPAQFPRVFAWINRFDTYIKAASLKTGKPKSIKGPQALEIVSGSQFAEAEGDVDANDPMGLKKGQEVEIWPIDSGSTNKDRGKLVALNGNEVVIERQTKKGKVVRVHCPRHGFRVRGVEAGGAKL